MESAEKSLSACAHATLPLALPSASVRACIAGQRKGAVRSKNMAVL